MNWIVKLSTAALPQALPQADPTSDTAGPFNTEEIVSLFQNDFLDGLTLIKPTGGDAAWDEISTVELLRPLIIVDEKEEAADLQKNEDIKPAKRQRKIAQGKKTHGSKQNTGVFVSGLPKENLDEAEFINHMKRGGVIKINPHTVKPHVKIYRNDDHQLTGSALVIYALPESVALAIKYLDGSWLDYKTQIHVEPATFTAKKEEKPLESKQLDQTILKKRRLAARIEESRQLSWAEDTPSFSATKASSKVLLLRPCWAEEHASRYRESSKIWNWVAVVIKKQLVKMNVPHKKIMALPRHPLGVVCIKFKSSDDAEALVLRCQSENVDISPIRILPEFKDIPSQLVFYDGVTDLQSQCLLEDEDETYFDEDTDLDALDRLWLLAAGINPSELNCKETTIKPEEQQRKLDELGDWLEGQSSEDEFAIAEEED